MYGKIRHAANVGCVHTIRAMLFPLLTLLSSDIPIADAYHAISTGYGGILATLASVRTKKPLLLTEHGIYTREREEEIIRADWILPSMRNNGLIFSILFQMLSIQKQTVLPAYFQKLEKFR